MPINPIKRELVKNALATVADNIIVSVIRTSRTTLVKNNLDFSSSICDAKGEMVAQGLALPAHLGATMPALRYCLDYFGDDLEDGDIMANNDPYSGGSHLNDIFMFKPIFKNGERVCILALILHHSDLGGRVAGGNAADSMEIFQEGVRIPPCKIQVRGTVDPTVMRFIQYNTRIPEKTMGDVRSQIAALNAADRDLQNILADYEVGEFKAYMKALVDYTEELARASIRALPDGEVEFTEWNDDDGVGNGPIRIHLKLTVKGDRIVADYSGTSPQMGGSLHTNYWFTASLTYAGLRTIMPAGMPNNAGFYRPITIIAPEGSWVNPRFPAALGARGQGGYRIRSIILGALAKLLPGRYPACCGGSEFGLSVAGYDRAGKPFLHLEFHNMTGHGGGPDRDGQEGGPYCLGNLANTPVEYIEADSPLRIEEYSLIPDSGGPGEYRGSLGIARRYRLLAEKAVVNLRSDRHKTACWGLFGGRPGRKARSLRNPHTNAAEELPSKFVREFRKDDVFLAEMAASGGYGDPFARDPGRVLEDVIDEKVTVAHAGEAYGVVIDPARMEVDREATNSARQGAASRG
ncbi:MAG: hydantoinase B/oxoprolinase family protein [Proteobacteria bacterium]|nr:hydantoinase B/oxoprolinase family protein [Pseudomonadota bacterium]